MSFDYLKDHLSPETVDKYGPKPESPKPAAAAEPATNTETPPAQEEAATESGGKIEDTSADPPEPKEGE